MLVKMGSEFVDPGLVEYVYELDVDETGPGGIPPHGYRGEPGFVRFDAEDGPVLVNARFVARLRRADDEETEIETASGKKVVVAGQPDWVASVLNRVRRVGAIA